MMSPHVETATLTVEVSQEQSREGILVEVIALSAQEDAIAKLQDFMALHPDAREVRKALAVKLVYQGYLYDEIQTILDVSRGSITAWKQAYEEDGIDGLRLNYKGRKSYLLSAQREEVLSWLQTLIYLGTWRTGI